MEKIINKKEFGTVSVVQNKRYEWAVVDNTDNFIVPFGKYAWIDGFDSGLARVRTAGKSLNTKNAVCIVTDDSRVIFDQLEIQSSTREDFALYPETFQKWGIINTAGEEVVPLEYDEIWNFYGKGRFSTKAMKDGAETDLYFKNLPGSTFYQEEDEYSCQDCDDSEYFSIDDCYDEYGDFDYDRLEDAIMDGEYVPEDW